MEANLIGIDLDVNNTLFSLIDKVKQNITKTENILYFTSNDIKFNINTYNTYIQFSNFLSTSELKEKITSIVFRGVLGTNLVPLIFTEFHTVYFTGSTYINFETKENIFWLLEYLSLNSNKEYYDIISNLFKYTSSERLIILHQENLKSIGINIELY